MSDDPLAKLEADAHQLVQALSSAGAAVPEALQLAGTLELAIARTSRALGARQAAELAARRGAETRSAVAEAERRAAELEQHAQLERSARRLALLEREVEALLDASSNAGRTFYESRARELETALVEASGRRLDLEARLSAGAEASAQSEMERSRAAALAGAARDEENALHAERASVLAKLERLRAR